MTYTRASNSTPSNLKTRRNNTLDTNRTKEKKSKSSIKKKDCREE